MKNIPLEESLNLSIQYAKREGIIPTIVQDATSKEVLMLGYANQEALEKTIATGYATFWSTSRKVLWTKGESSGNLLQIQEIRVDCDQDALLYVVNKIGQGACHAKDNEGNTRNSCFYRKITAEKNLEML